MGKPQRLQVRPSLRLVPATPRRKTWTREDYEAAIRSAKQEMLLQDLVEHVLRSGLSQTEIAARAGIAQSTVHRWLSGDSKSAMARTLLAAGKVLGGTLGWTWSEDR